MWVVNMSWGCIWPKSATWGDDWGVSEAIQMFWYVFVFVRTCFWGPRIINLSDNSGDWSRLSEQLRGHWPPWYNWCNGKQNTSWECIENFSLFWGANKNANNQQYHVGLKLELVNFMRAVIYLGVSLNRQVLFIRFQLRLNLQISRSEFLEFLVRRPICLQPRWSNSGKQGREIKGLLIRFIILPWIQKLVGGCWTRTYENTKTLMPANLNQWRIHMSRRCCRIS